MVSIEEYVAKKMEIKYLELGKKDFLAKRLIEVLYLLIGKYDKIFVTADFIYKNFKNKKSKLSELYLKAEELESISLFAVSVALCCFEEIPDKTLLEPPFYDDIEKAEFIIQLLVKKLDISEDNVKPFLTELRNEIDDIEICIFFLVNLKSLGLDLIEMDLDIVKEVFLNKSYQELKDLSKNINKKIKKIKESF